MENKWNEKKEWMNDKFDEKMEWLEEKHDRKEDKKTKDLPEEDMKTFSREE